MRRIPYSVSIAFSLATTFHTVASPDLLASLPPCSLLPFEIFPACELGFEVLNYLCSKSN